MIIFNAPKYQDSLGIQDNCSALCVAEILIVQFNASSKTHQYVIHKGEVVSVFEDNKHFCTRFCVSIIFYSWWYIWEPSV